MFIVVLFFTFAASAEEGSELLLMLPGPLRLMVS
jgi:hypothetical protein